MVLCWWSRVVVLFVEFSYWSCDVGLVELWCWLIGVVVLGWWSCGAGLVELWCWVSGVAVCAVAPAYCSVR